MKKKRILVVIGVIAFVGILSQSFSYFKMKENMGKYENISEQVKMKKGKFLNAEPTKTMTQMRASTFKEFMIKGDKVPAKPLPTVAFNSGNYLKSDTSILSVTWFGHSSALFEVDGKLILTDPAFSESAGPVSWAASKRFKNKDLISAAQLPELDVVLISHDHYDHLDQETITQLAQKTKQFLVPLGVAKYLIKWGVSADKIQEFSWWENTSFEGIEFVSTPARHFSGRGLINRNSTLWCSWVIKGSEHSVFFSGDSGYQKDFKVIGEKYGPFDLGLLECGQYNDDWGLIHMSPEESVQAGLDTKTKLALPIHWGAFSLSVHAWYEPIERFTNKAEELDLSMITPQIGERIVINDSVSNNPWWKAIR